jgi:hypothetical protein
MDWMNGFQAGIRAKSVKSFHTWLGSRQFRYQFQSGAMQPDGGLGFAQYDSVICWE